MLHGRLRIAGYGSWAERAWTYGVQKGGVRAAEWREPIYFAVARPTDPTYGPEDQRHS